MLECRGFGVKLCSWIKCIYTAKFFVLVNDNLTCFFSSSRDLRQGDPLSPLLFVIVMEVLNKMISTLVQHDFLVGFSVGDLCRGTLSISHSLFADDTLLFCEVDLN